MYVFQHYLIVKNHQTYYRKQVWIKPSCKKRVFIDDKLIWSEHGEGIKKTNVIAQLY